MDTRFFQDILINKKSQEQHLFEIEIFYNMAKSFIVTFDKFNAYLLNKRINFLKKQMNLINESNRYINNKHLTTYWKNC